MNAPVRRLIPLGLLACLAVVTLGPVRWRPRFSFDADTDRMLGYAALGYGLGLVYPRRPGLAAGVVLLTAVGLELGQMIVPSRHARMHDAVIKSGGGLIGVASATLPLLLSPLAVEPDTARGSGGLRRRAAHR